MVQNKVNEQDVIDKASKLDFPSSVVEYFQGYLGIPPYGFPEPLRTNIIRSLPRIEGRPGKSLKALDFVSVKEKLKAEYGNLDDTDILSYALYPKVFKEFKSVVSEFGDLSLLPTRYFLSPPNINEELSVELEPGKILIVKYLALGSTNPKTGCKDVFFSVNGESRVVVVKDKHAALKFDTRPKANSSMIGEVGAPMGGVIIEMRVKVGTHVNVGDPLFVLSAMKMETVVSASVSGLIEQIIAGEGESVSAGDLIVKIGS
jgi:pyruvate carboxylase